MFDPASNYYHLETASLYSTDDTGRTTLYLYKRRRFLPSFSGQTMLVEHRVRQGDRLDNLAAQYLRDPLQAYRLYEANPVLHPDELLTSLHRRIRITMPGF
jgi:hypothetical protein